MSLLQKTTIFFPPKFTGADKIVLEQRLVEFG